MQDQEEALAGQFEQIQSEGKMPEPSKLPGLYCANGKSTCVDLEGKRSCLCPACSVHIKNELKSKYYCLSGSIEEVE